MPRPKLERCIRFNPKVRYFKPKGIPLRRIEEVVLEKDELEALKLHDVNNLKQKEASLKMKISQPTFARILNSAYGKISNALVNGKAIKIVE